MEGVFIIQYYFINHDSYSFTSKENSFVFNHSTALHTSGDEFSSVTLSIGIHLAPNESCPSNCSGAMNSLSHFSTP